MRDRYYCVKTPSDAPQKAVLVHVYRRLGQALARIEGEDEADEAQPDLVLFRAALERLRQNLVGTFVFVDDRALWQPHWGDLVDYQGALKWQKPAPPEEAPAVHLEPDLSEAWDYTLNLNSITSPSLTT